MRNLKLAMISIKKNFQNAKELKSSFITSVLGMCLNNCALIALWFHFGAVVGDINGWGRFDVIGLYGFNSVAFGITFSFLYGINNLPMYISSGNFDKYLLTPKNTLIKVATSAVSTSAIGDLLFGLICYITFIFIAKLTILQIIASIFLMIIVSVVFFSINLICMSVSFYLMDGENISNGMFQMFFTPSLYHGGAFSEGLRIVFIFIIPSLLIGALPIEILKHITFQNLAGISVLTIIWLFVSILFFYHSLRKYESNNFFGFNG